MGYDLGTQSIKSTVPIGIKKSTVHLILKNMKHLYA